MKPMKVLIVDDDPDFAEGLGMTLELEGHEVSFASSGEEAVIKFGQHDFDITLMDVRMPGMNGVETLRKIREIKADAKVLVITAYKVEGLLTQVLADGAANVLQKPVASQTLLDELKRLHLAGVVMIADDDPDFSDGVEQALTEAGYSVILARTGSEAVEKAVECDIDVLLLDIRMPDITGLEVYRELKKLGHNPPTIIVTGFNAEESSSVQELLKMSARDLLVKPVRTDELLRAIESVA